MFKDLVEGEVQVQVEVGEYLSKLRKLLVRGLGTRRKAEMGMGVKLVVGVGLEM